MAGKIRIVALLLLLVGAPVGVAAAAEEGGPRTLSLEDAIRLAFQNDADVVAQEKEVVVAQAAKLGAEGQFLPKLSGIGGYTHRDAVLTLPAAITSTFPKDAGVIVGYGNELRLGFMAEQPIYKGGRNLAGFRASKIQLTSQEETLRAKKLSVELETKRLYYGLLLAAETERIAQRLVDQTQQHYRDVDKKFRQGTVSRFDLLQSKVQVSKVTPQLLAAQKSRQVIAAELKKELGMAFEQEVTLAGKLAFSQVKIDEASFQAEALAHNPEIALKRLGIDIGKQNVEIAKSGWKPDVGGNIRYEYISDDVTNMFNDRHNNWTAGVNITIPLFDGFSALSKTRQAKARFEIAKTEKEDVEKRVAIDVKRACLDLAEAAAVVESQRESVAEAKEALHIAEVSYANGVGTNLDVLDAEVSLATVEKNLSEGIYDELMAEASLNRSRGVSNVMEGHDGKAP